MASDEFAAMGRRTHSARRVRRSSLKADPVSSLFILHTGSNVGYAIAPLETLFYEIGMDLADHDARRVHLAYRSLTGGFPRSLPSDFGNVIAYDFTDTGPGNVARLAAYVKQHAIRLVLIFDIQPVHPLFRRLRRAGATTILAYWGAPISSPMPSWKLLLKKIQLAVSPSKVDGLIFESQAMAALATDGRGVPREMIDVVPLGIDVGRFAGDHTDYAYETLGIPSDRKIVMYAGHMERRKGVHTLIRAAIHLLAERGRSDVCFLICGNTGDQSKELQRMYAGMGIDEFIRFGGYRDDLPQIYTSCYCGVIPSTGWDSFPRTSLEMAAAGLPVIASRLQGLPEAVADRETGLLFEPGDALELARCLAKLLDEPELASQFRRVARERCQREFTLEVQRARLLAAVHRHLGQNRPGRSLSRPVAKEEVA
jgi:glycosyltransferase involved in cell wall biosynthesis